MVVHYRTDHRTERGFSLIEILTVVGLVAVVAAMAVPVTNQAITWARADSATEAALRAITAARDRAIAERRNIELTFVTPNRIRLEREEINSSGVATGKTIVAESYLENGQAFIKFTGVPDTPDAFGNSAAVTFGGTAPFMFTSDGSFVDSAGDVVNGTVLVGTPDQPATGRAVTVFGVSGLTTLWKWRGGRWVK